MKEDKEKEIEKIKENINKSNSNAANALIIGFLLFLAIIGSTMLVINSDKVKTNNKKEENKETVELKRTTSIKTKSDIVV